MFEQFEELLKELEKFKINLNKENKDRRYNLEVITTRSRKLDILEEQFKQLETEYRLVSKEQIDTEKIINVIAQIRQNIRVSRDILLERKRNVDVSVNTDWLRLGDNTDFSSIMERFDLKTASSLLPVMNDSETVTSQLIDAVELYSSMLDEVSQGFLINYILKTRLSPSAKLRLNLTYTTVDNLIADMKLHLLTKKSAASLSIQLHKTKQNDKSIEAYGKQIEELMVNLTISQANIL